MKNIKLFQLISLFMLYLGLVSSLSAEILEKKKVLLLHSYHPGMTWVKNINKAVYETLQNNNENIILYTEYMDTKRHHSTEYYQVLKDVYKEKYNSIDLDYIMTTDNNAYNFLIKNRDEIFGEIPVIFSGVNSFESEQIKNITKFTGVAEQFSVKETVDLILNLHPNIKQIYIINDYLLTGLAWQRDIKKSLKGYEEKVDLIYAKNLTLVELKNKISSFKEDTAILMGVYFADKNNEYITYEKTGSYLLGNSSSPAYCLLNFNISNNVIGGKVISGYSQGEAMSKILLRIMNGIDINTIPIQSFEANNYIFNYQGLNKHNIDLTSLPKDSSVINQPFSLHDEYIEILSFMITILVFILIAISLLLTYYKSNKETTLINFIRFTPIFALPLFTLFVVWILLNNVNQSYQKALTHEKQSYIQSKQNEAKREVDRFIEIARTRLSLKHNIDKRKLQENFLTIASNINYNKSGYILIGTLDGKMLVHPNEELEGVDFFDGKHPQIKEIFLKFKKVIDLEGKGFTSYLWENPSSLELENKISYVREFPEFNWYVAAGVYLDEIDKHMETKLKNNEELKEKNLYSVVILFVILLIITIITSVGLSILIKNIFKKYKENIINEIEKNKKIEASKKEFEQLATIDSLTQVYNRFSIMNMLHKEFQKMRKENSNLCIIMFDLDFFKNVNDQFGHDVGDIVLIDICKLVQKNLREQDRLGRYGGEEFFVILPHTILQTAKEIAERLRKEVELHQFDKVNHITISLGVIEASADENDEQLFKRLDSLLYKSKRDGRNRVSS